MTVDAVQTVDRQIQDATARAIRTWNREATARYRDVGASPLSSEMTMVTHIPQSREHRLIKALLYPVGDARPHIVFLPIRIPSDDDPHSASWAEDAEVSQWFPIGVRYVRVSSIPATGFQLTNDYTIITSTFHRNGPQNRCINEVLGIALRGNVLVMRHSCSRPMTIVNVHPSERRLIDLVITR